MALRAGAKADWACGAGRSGECGRPVAAGTWSRWDGGRGETGIAEVGGPTEKLEGRGPLGEGPRARSVFDRGGAVAAGDRAIAVGAANGQVSSENGNACILQNLFSGFSRIFPCC